MAMTKSELETLEHQVQEQRLVDQAARAADVHALGKDYRPVADEIAAIESNRLNKNAQEMNTCADRRATINGNTEMTEEQKAQQRQIADDQMYTLIAGNNAAALQQGEAIYSRLPESVAAPYQEAQENLQARYDAEKQKYDLEQEQQQHAQDNAPKNIDQMDGPPGTSGPAEQTQEQNKESKFIDLDQEKTPDATPLQTAPPEHSKFVDLSQYQESDIPSPEPVKEQPAQEAPHQDYERDDLSR